MSSDNGLQFAFIISIIIAGIVGYSFGERNGIQNAYDSLSDVTIKYCSDAPWCYFMAPLDGAEYSIGLDISSILRDMKK